MKVIQEHHYTYKIKIMKKQDIPKWVLILFVVCVGMFFLVRFDRSDEKEALNAERMELVGKYVLLAEDTLKIVRYHVWHKEYILEDGHRASPEMVAVLLIR